MGKRRAYEVSKELGIETSELIGFAEQVGISIKNHMSTLEEEDVIKIKHAIEKPKKKAVVEKRVGNRIIRRRKVKPPPEPEVPELEEQEAPEAAEGEEPEEALQASDEDLEVSEESESEEPPEAVEETEEAPEAVEGEEVEIAAEGTQAEASEALGDETAEAGEAKKPKAKKKVRKPRQISKIVKRIDVEDLQPAEAPAKSDRPAGRAPGRAAARPASTAWRGKTQAPVDIAQPVVESGRRRGKGGRVEEEDGRGRKRKGRGTRKRHTIDDSYFDRRGGRGDRKKNRDRQAPHKTAITTPKAIKRVIKLATETIIVGELAKRMGIKANELILKLIQMGLQANINQAIDQDTATLVANEFEYEIENVTFEEDNFLGVKSEDEEEDLKSRPPIVTVMGHVDHGKTSILDHIRETHVAAGEAGGITQHIGAYVVRKESGNITFLDTPGHEAFTSMRARGAQITDLVILVVAADDGVMPQTIEAINHSRAAGVPLIVAVNKIDKANANPERVRTELMQHSVVPEELGGDVIIVNVSAKTGDGIDTLLEMVTLQSEVLEMKANPDRETAEAIVVEGKLDRGRGPVGTVLVRQGTLKVGDYFVCGAQAHKIKAMISDAGHRVDEAFPSEPVEILGFQEVPEAGEIFNTLKDEKQSKAIAQNRYLKKREAELAKSSRVSLEELVERAKASDTQTLPLVVKGDVQGTVEALKDALVKLSIDEVKIDIIHTGVGGITESDVIFASASEALILGFNVRPETKAHTLAEVEGVEIKLYSVIYNLLEDIQRAVQGLTIPKFREEITGHVEVRDTFTIPKVGTIAGSYVLDGKVKRNSDVRLIRDNVVIYAGKLSSLRRFKEDVGEVQSGYECGIGIENYNDIKVGDNMEFFKEVEVKQDAI